MNRFATPDFSFCHRLLPPEVRALADKNFGPALSLPTRPTPQGRLRRCDRRMDTCPILSLISATKQRLEVTVGPACQHQQRPQDRAVPAEAGQVLTVKLADDRRIDQRPQARLRGQDGGLELLPQRPPQPGVHRQLKTLLGTPKARGRQPILQRLLEDPFRLALVDFQGCRDACGQFHNS